MSGLLFSLLHTPVPGFIASDGHPQLEAECLVAAADAAVPAARSAGSVYEGREPFQIADSAVRL